MKIKALLSVLICIAASTLSAQSGKSTARYTISGKISGLKDTAVYLANYYGNKLYYNDTARVDAKGNFSFEGKPYSECGKYAFVMPGPKYFDFIVAEENIFIEADSSNNVEKIRFRESKNNQLFYDYIRFINGKRKEREPIDVVLSDSTKTDDQKKPFREQLDVLNKTVIDYQKNLIATNTDLLVSKLLRMSMDIEMPESPAGLSEEERVKWNYFWYRQHYWDNVDLTDPRLVRDPAFHKVLERFLTQTLPQIPDTMCAETKKLVDRTGANYDAFKYIVHQATYLAETSKIMCMDRWFVFMVDNWYKTGKVDWIKEDKLKNIIESADEKRFCLCGEIAPDIILPDTTENRWVSMHGLNAKYTLLVIWEATCGHCKKEVPKLYELYQKWKDKGLAVYALEGELENDKWKKFIREKNLLDWTNVSDTPAIMQQDSASKLIWKGVTTLQSLNFRKAYDVSSTPKVFLMDRDHRIIAKQLSAEQFEELLGKLEKGEDIDASRMKQTEYEDEDEAPVKKPGTVRQQPNRPKQ
jgi:peroxiredoxin